MINCQFFFLWARFHELTVDVQFTLTVMCTSLGDIFAYLNKLLNFQLAFSVLSILLQAFNLSELPSAK